MQSDASPKTKPPAPPPEYLRPAEMAREIGVSRDTLYAYAKKPGFPVGVNLSRKCRLFHRAAVLTWVSAQARVA